MSFFLVDPVVPEDLDMVNSHFLISEDHLCLPSCCGGVDCCSYVLTITDD